MKYYLLTFNDDYADEHSIPALACFTEEEYNRWRELPSGTLNENYIEEKAAFDESVRKYSSWKVWLVGNKLLDQPYEKWTPEQLAYRELNQADYPYYLNKPAKVQSNMRARLGNGGDGFEENYEHLYLMEEFVEGGYVEVIEVEEVFYKTFKAARLDRLSLCNVFEINE